MELTDIKKVGPKTIEALNDLDIYTMDDLVNYYPYRYNIYNPINLEEASNLSTVTVNATIESEPKVFYIKRNLNRLTFKAMSGHLLFNVTIFNRAYLKTHLDIGKEITLVGKYDKMKNSFVASNLTLGFTTEIKIEPIYHLNKKMKNSSLNEIILNALNLNIELIDYIPDALNQKYAFLDKKAALNVLHKPLDVNSLKLAKMRLIYEEFFLFMLKINYLKKKNDKIIGLPHQFSNEDIYAFIEQLPFELTYDQQKAIDECLADLRQAKRMNRLIEGDVGSGKTIVAAVCMYATFLSGYQSALMAPTEILAKQHFTNIKQLFSNFDVNIELLTGGQSKKEHQNILAKLKTGEINIIIGTHALISDDVEFKNLGLVVTDEQHRFGVNQRNNLQNKGHLPDIIYMSATPIPRTYALVIYKDMATSMIKTKPSGRKEIKTFIKKESELKSVLESLWLEIKNGHQIYVVAPAIEEQENTSLYDVNTLKEKFNKAFNNKVPMAILHGKIKPKEKEKIMNQFKTGEIKILIATTVIEVGVDVENATTIVIFNADNYGLATLHQLRGRVGRNNLDSYCYLISNKEDNQRLKVLCESNDGFYISEQDFLMRREGDLFGTKQSGDMVFKIGDLKKDFKILLQAKEDSQEFIEKEEYKNFPQYQKIIDKLTNLD